MAFKSLEVDPEESWKMDYSLGYHQLRQFVLDAITDKHGVDALSKLPLQLDSYLEDLNEQQVSEIHAVDHPALFPDLIYGDICVEFYRCILRERVPPPPSTPSPGQGPPSPGQGPPQPQPQSPPGQGPPPLSVEPKRLARYSHLQVPLDIGASQMLALIDCLNHQILPQFLPHAEKRSYDPAKWPFNLSSVKSGRLDAAIVSIEVSRHATIHAEEDQVVNLVLQHNIFKDYSRADLVQVVRYVYPHLLRVAYDWLIKNKEWERLRIEERFPRPTLYQAPSNAPYVVADIVLPK